MFISQLVRDQVWPQLWQYSALIVTSQTQPDRCSERMFTRPKAHRLVRPCSCYRVCLYAFNLFGIFRLLMGSLVLHTNIWLEWLEYDAFIGVFRHAGLFTRNGCLAFAPLPVCVLYFDYVLHLKRFNYVWFLIYDLVVVNPRRFTELNPQLGLSPSMRHPVRLLASLFRLAVRCLPPRAPSDQVDQFEDVCFDQTTLKYHANASKRMRVIALLYSWFLQLVIALEIICSVPVTLGMCWYNDTVFLVPASLSLTRRAIVWLDMCAIGYCAQVVIVAMLYFLNSANLLLVMLHRRLTRYRISLAKCIDKLCCNRSLCKYQLAMTLARHRVEYSIVRRHAHFTNSHIFSPILQAAAVSNFAYSTYIVAYLSLSGTSTLGLHAILTAALGCHCLVAISCTVGLVRLARDLYRPGALLMKAQVNLMGGLGVLRTKWHLVVDVEHIHCRKRFYFTLGSLGKVSSKSVLQFLFIYTGSIMFFLKMITNQSTYNCNF